MRTPMMPKCFPAVKEFLKRLLFSPLSDWAGAPSVVAGYCGHNGRQPYRNKRQAQLQATKETDMGREKRNTLNDLFIASVK